MKLPWMFCLATFMVVAAMATSTETTSSSINCLTPKPPKVIPKPAPHYKHPKIKPTPPVTPYPSAPPKASSPPPPSPKTPSPPPPSPKAPSPPPPTPSPPPPSPKPSPPPPKSPSPTPAVPLPPYTASPPPPATCPVNIIKLQVCVPLLGGILGDPLDSDCCALLGIIGLDVEICLCAAIDADVLGLIGIHTKLDIIATILTTCGKKLPPNFTCP